MANETNLELELKNMTENVKVFSSHLIEILEVATKDHFRWLMAINTGSLIWLISALDQFCINEHLFWKWLYIVILFLQMISAVMFFWFNGAIFNAIVQSRLLNMGINSSKFESLDYKNELIQRSKEIEQLFPKLRTALITDFMFALSFLLLAIYVIFFIILHR